CPPGRSTPGPAGRPVGDVVFVGPSGWRDGDQAAAGGGAAPVVWEVVGLFLGFVFAVVGRVPWRMGCGEGPGGGAGGVWLFVAGGPFDDVLDTGPAGCLEGGERRLGAGLVAQALGEHDRVFDGQGGALARGGGGGVGGGADDDHLTVVPAGQGRGGAGGGVVGGGGGGAEVGWGGGRAPRA